MYTRDVIHTGLACGSTCTLPYSSSAKASELYSIYRSRTEIFISCVCPTCSISLAERIYRTWSKIFISRVGGRHVVYHSCSLRSTRDIQQVDPYPADKYFRPRPIKPLSKWYRTGRTDTADKRHCKLAHQSQFQNCATFTSHIWSLLWKTWYSFFPPLKT